MRIKMPAIRAISGEMLGSVRVMVLPQVGMCGGGGGVSGAGGAGGNGTSQRAGGGWVGEVSVVGGGGGGGGGGRMSWARGAGRTATYQRAGRGSVLAGGRGRWEPFMHRVRPARRATHDARNAPGVCRKGAAGKPPARRPREPARSRRRKRRRTRP